jgi:hypothetical protein
VSRQIRAKTAVFRRAHPRRGRRKTRHVDWGEVVVSRFHRIETQKGWGVASDPCQDGGLSTPSPEEGASKDPSRRLGRGTRPTIDVAAVSC